MADIRNEGRIIYVEPNEIEGRGYNELPDYSDYCIYFNLVVDTYSRINNIGVDGSNTKMITWSSILKDKDGKVNYNPISFLSGNLKDGDDRYLTTWYSDIHFNELERYQVEGLGVSSVDISFESYYTPTVRIKFVDVRGASLFDQEEYRHNNGAITSESVFGSFFTLPYPKFKLQVKGFYGDAVTYQLMLSDFKGSFNSNSGNFEIDASFIGYSYSLLTDIPFSYIVSAPLCTYYGKEYWDSKVNSPEWAISSDNNNGKMITLFEMYKQIKDGFLTSNVEVNDYLENDEINKIELLKAKKENLQFIEENINKLENLYLEKVKERISLIKLNNNNALYPEEGIKWYQNERGRIYIGFLLKKGVEGKIYDKLDFIVKNDKGEDINLFTEINRLIDLFNETSDEKLNKVKFGLVNDDSEIKNDSNVQEIRTILNNKLRNSKDYKYWYSIVEIFDRNIIKNIKIKNDNILKGYVDVINERRNNQISTNIKIKPKIGDVVKIIMAHLETFVYMMNKCSENIMNNIDERTPSKLGIRIEKTDLNNSDFITPWSSVYNINNGDSSSENVLSWVGDFSPNFEEIKLVESLQNAYKQIVEETNQLNNKISGSQDFKFNSVLDIVNNENPFKKMLKELTNFEGVVDALGQRIAYMLGVAYIDKNDLNYYKELGKVDGYSLSTMFGDVEMIKRIFFNDGVDLVKKLEESLLLINKEDKLSYEENGEVYNIVNDKNGGDKSRQPYFLDKKNGNVEYIRYYVYNDKELEKSKENYIPIIFDKIEPLSERQNIIQYNSEEKKYKIGDYERIIFNSNLIDLDNTTEENIIDISNYENNFHIETQSGKVEYYNGILKESGGDSVLINEGRYELIDTIAGLFYDYKKLSLKETDDGKIKIEQRGSESLSKLEKKINDKEEAIDNNVDKLNIISGQKRLSTNISPFSYDLIYEKEKLFGNDKVNINVKSDKISVDNGEWVGLNDELVIISKTPVLVRYGENAEISALNYFLSPVYFSQEIEGLSEEDILLRRAYLFVNLHFNHNSNNLFLDKRNKNTFIEKASYLDLLKIGSEFYREKIKGKNDIKLSVDFYNHYFIDGLDIKKKAIKGLDYYVENKLYNLFIDFAKGDFKKINDKLSLKYNNKPLDKKTLDKFLNDSTEDGKTGFIGDLKKENKANYESIYFITLGNGRNGKKNYLIDSFYKCDGKSEIQKLLKEVLFKEVYLIKNVSSLYQDKTNNKINFKRDALSYYIGGISEALRGLINKEDKISNLSNTNILNNIDDNLRDVKISTYMYLKNIWDKWLCNSKEEDFTINKFFSNFLFIDSFYKNIHSKLLINYDKFIQSYEGRFNNSSFIYNILSDIAQANNCLLLSMPDYIDLGSDNKEKAIKSLERVFKPIPFKDMREIDMNNKFIFVYTHKPSEIASNNGSRGIDSYDIWDNEKDDFSPIAKEIFSSDIVNDTEEGKIYGYNVPSFGVSFSKQNNSIFKNVQLNMSNPIQTEQSIKTLIEMSKLGSNSPNKVMYYGQDIYPIFSNYSYTCEVEMMGNAQIMPLMYFQLMNIPMWRGSYMIYKVTHSISPGQMVTRFTGMKMSYKSLPFVKDFVIGGNLYKVNNNTFDTTNGIDDNTSVLYRDDYNINTTDDSDYFNNKEYNLRLDRGTDKKPFNKGGKKYYVDKRLAKLFNNLVVDIKNNFPNEKWSINVTSSIRVDNSISDHYYTKGRAIDIQIKKNNLKQRSSTESDKEQKELLIVLDIVLSKYFFDNKYGLRQIILEQRNPKPDTYYHVLHLSVNDNDSQDNKKEYWMGHVDNSMKTTRYGKKYKGIDSLLGIMSGELRKLMKKHYLKINNADNFKKYFIDFSSYDKTILDRAFLGVNNTNDEGGTYKEKKVDEVNSNDSREVIKGKLLEEVKKVIANSHKHSLNNSRFKDFSKLSEEKRLNIKNEIASSIVNNCIETKYDISLLMAQMQLETGYGSTNIESLKMNSVFGVASHKGGKKYNSFDESVKDYIRLMNEHYVNKKSNGITDVEDIINRNFKKRERNEYYNTNTNFYVSNIIKIRDGIMKKDLYKHWLFLIK